MAIVLTLLSAFVHVPTLSGVGIVVAIIAAALIIRIGSTLVHELGHLFVGLMRGWRIIAFAVRPLVFQAPSSSVAFASRKLGNDARGWVFMMPRHPENATRTNMAAYIAGGPAASIALAAVALCGAPFLSLPPGSNGQVDLGYLATAIGLQALFDAMFTLLPNRRPGRQTDGDKLLELWRSRYDPYRFPALAYAATLRLYDVRLRETPQWMIDAARQDGGLSSEIQQTLNGIEIGAALDAATVDPVQARSLIDRYRADYGDSEWLASCDAYLAAVWENDPARARTIAWSGVVTDDQRPLVLAVEAAIAARLGEVDAARDRLSQMDIARRGRTRFRDVMFDDIRSHVRNLIPAPPA